MEPADENARTWRPPGHFYSPIPDVGELRARRERIFDRSLRTLPGIELHEAAQVELVRSFLPYYAEQPFPAQRSATCRYWFENEYYSYSDALFLYFVLRHARPRRVIEVGSGFSTAALLDTSERFLGGALRVTCIEPDPARLRSLLWPRDRAAVEIVERPVQDVPLERFDELASGDVLFVDSTHVLKTGSDVCFLLFEVLPRLAPGVLVHVHDVHYPFEYPAEWALEGRAWNEAYALRAFLQFNQAFRVFCFPTFLELFHTDWFWSHMPLCLKNPGGSIWLQRAPAAEPGTAPPAER